MITDWIGKGIQFPKTFNSKGSTASNNAELRISQSINMILSTPIGTRFFLPSFGSRLHELLFEPNDLILQDMISYYAKDALDIWEKRISVTKIVADANNGTNEVPVTIYYRLRNSNIEYNYVYPFKRSIMEL